MKTHQQLTSILVTGASGLLGKSVCQLLDQQQITYCTATRNKNAVNAKTVYFDLAKPETLYGTLSGIHTILHLASDKKHPDNDISGTAALLNEIKKEKRPIHLIYISIVGTDELLMTYFKQKAATEALITASGCRFTILRATQFHEYLAEVLEMLSFFPFLLFIPKRVPVQPIDVAVVAEKLVNLVEQPASMAINEIGGPDKLDLKTTAQEWLSKYHKRKWLITIPLWGTIGKKLRGGILTTHKKTIAGYSWNDWLSAR